MSGENSNLLQVCIIGSGPAGYYTAEALSAEENVRVDIIDKLPTPYGLIRGGVAPDHQSIKGVYRRYEKASLADNVRFAGNIEVGRDVTLAELRDMYDAVILAVGAPKDRTLGIPGDDKEGVIGSAEFVGWYNSHPDFAGLDPDLDIQTVVVIGNGNVAVDAARVLAKTVEEMAASDLAPYASKKIQASSITDIYMLGRRGPLEAKFTPKEMGELGQLEACITLTDPDQIPDLSEEQLAKLTPVIRKNMAHLKTFTENKTCTDKKTLHMQFFSKPLEILGDDKVTGIRLEKTCVEDGKCIGTGETFEIDCQMVIPCIGYRSLPLEGAKFREDWGSFDNSDSKIEDGLYCTGWARRGPTGTIGTNRKDGQEVAARVLAEVTASGRPGRSALDAHAAEKGVDIITFADWKKIEAAEESAASGEAPRVKFHLVADMIKAARS